MYGFTDYIREKNLIDILNIEQVSSEMLDIDSYFEYHLKNLNVVKHKNSLYFTNEKSDLYILYSYDSKILYFNTKYIHAINVIKDMKTDDIDSLIIYKIEEKFNLKELHGVDKYISTFNNSMMMNIHEIFCKSEYYNKNK